MRTPVAAAIYTRISSDVEGLGLGVTRQREDCEKLAASLGWGVADVYSDNDVSAYSGKRRPEYERMLSDLADGHIDGVLVYHIDRLTRRPIELEEFVQAVDAAKVKHVRFVTGDADISTGDGLLVARMLSAVAASESATKSRRVRRKQEQNAAAGKPHKGSTRPFGYESDHLTVRAEEAEVYRQAVARFLAGESTRSIASWLNAQEVPTVKGGTWGTPTLKGMLVNPRYAGLLVHSGDVVGAGTWEPIISEDDHRRVLAKFAQRMNSGRRAPQRYLLSGMTRCGKCGNTMYSASRIDTRRYECRSGPDHGGCGKSTVIADPVERLVADFVLYRLDSAELADTLRGKSSADARTSELSAVVDQASEQLQELAAAYGMRDIKMTEWMTAKKPIEQRLENAQRQLAQVTHSTALIGLVGNGEELGRTWGALNLDRQHAIVEALVDHVLIGPGTPGVARFDPARVSVVWRH
ncbi:recombinase family protein [Nocardioides panacis]|uniref:Recombinase family protein n=1 Tax=Nocardioides panacis TaxID=2849501 RepID=A0A975T080_9ACTN|nr:recombinase family protein [Nocardioides panacis]QWZ09106.1 recombinase family protein [Nocardioides panacis]